VPGRSRAGQRSTSISCGIDAHVLSGAAYALTVVPGSAQPSSRSSSRSQSCTACVAVVWTWPTIARHSARSASSSGATIGTIPSETASTSTS
jgi:hypothetical protein